MNDANLNARPGLSLPHRAPQAGVACKYSDDGKVHFVQRGYRILSQAFHPLPGGKPLTPPHPCLS